jgi:hypothetical protein
MATQTHKNPTIIDARRIVLIDLENCHSGLFFRPSNDDYVLGFVHSLGLNNVRVNSAQYPVQVIISGHKDVVDTHIIFELSRLIADAKGHHQSLKVFVVTNDHFGSALSDVIKFYDDLNWVSFEHVTHLPPSMTKMARRNSM